MIFYDFFIYDIANSDADQVGISIILPGDGVEDKPVYVTPRLASQIHDDVILDLVEQVAQSRDSKILGSLLEVEIDRLLMSRGGGVPLNLTSITSLDKAVRSRKMSIISPDVFMDRGGKDCFAVSLVLCLFLKLGVPFPNVTSKRDFPAFKQKVRLEVERLNSLAQIDCNTLDHLAGEIEFNAFQEILKDNITRGELTNNLSKTRFFRIVIYSVDGKVLFSGELPNASFRGGNQERNVSKFDFKIGETEIFNLNLLLDNRHFHVIKSLTGCFCSKFFCQWCCKGYNHDIYHRKCDFTCDGCFQRPPCETLSTHTIDSNVYCDNCCRSFVSPLCFSNHVTKMNICLKIRNCPKCLRFISKKGQTCGESFCNTCKENKALGHFRFIPKYVSKAERSQTNLTKSVKKSKKKKSGYLFYDFESCLIKTSLGDYHKPNLAVSETVCEDCIDVAGSENNCTTCGERLNIFKVVNNDLDSVVDNFTRFLCRLSEKIDCIVIAHNQSRYDLLFIIRRLFLLFPHLKANAVIQGSRIYSFTVQGLRFVDSCLFSCCALSKLPKMFDLGVDVSKGMFPHLFSIPEHFDYIGRMPGIEYFDCDSMMPKQYECFLKWYDEVKDTVFDFQAELLNYCKNDVVILKLFCLKLSREMFKEVGISIFEESITLASFVNKVYRKNFYEGNISVIPKMGFRLSENTSKIGLKFIIYCEKYLLPSDVKMESAWHGRERIITVNGHRYKADGYYEIVNKKGEIEKNVIEFNGCYYHGHQNCPLNKRKHIHLNDVTSSKFTLSPKEYTERKIKELQSAGFIVLQKWECEFYETLKQQPEVKIFLEDFFKVDKLKQKTHSLGAILIALPPTISVSRMKG